MGEHQYYRIGKRNFWISRKGLPQDNTKLINYFVQLQYAALGEISEKNLIIISAGSSFPLENLFYKKVIKGNITEYQLMWDISSGILSTPEDNIKVSKEKFITQDGTKMFRMAVHDITKIIFHGKKATSDNIFEMYGNSHDFIYLTAKRIFTNQYSVNAVQSVGVPFNNKPQKKHYNNIGVITNNFTVLKNTFRNDQQKADSKKSIDVDLIADHDGALSSEFFDFDQKEGYFIELYDPRESIDGPTPVATISYEEGISYPIMMAEGREGKGISYIIYYKHFTRSKSHIIFQTHNIHSNLKKDMPFTEKFKVRVLDKDGNDLTGYKWEINIHTHPISSNKRKELDVKGKKDYWQANLHPNYKKLANAFDDYNISLLKKVFGDKAIIVRPITATHLRKIFENQLATMFDLKDFFHIDKNSFLIKSDNQKTELYSTEKNDGKTHDGFLKTSWKKPIYAIAHNDNTDNEPIGNFGKLSVSKVNKKIDYIIEQFYTEASIKLISSNGKTFFKEVITSRRVAIINGLAYYNNVFLYINKNRTVNRLPDPQKVEVAFVDATFPPSLPEGDKKNYSVTVKAGDDFLIPLEMLYFNNQKYSFFNIYDPTEDPDTPRPLAIVALYDDYCSPLSIADAEKGKGVNYVSQFAQTFIELNKSIVCRTSKDHPTLIAGKKLSEEFVITPLDNNGFPLTSKGRTVTITVVP